MNRLVNFIIKIVGIFILCMNVCLLNAQPKPKRDKAKDNVIHVQKKKVQTQKVKPQQKEITSNIIAQANAPAVSNKKSSIKNRGTTTKSKNRTAKRRRTYRNVASHSATYLTVDYSQSPSKTFSCYGDNISLKVNTDGSNWDYRMVGSWYRVYKDFFNNKIDIYVDRNPSHNERSDWFVVYSGSKSVKVTIQQQGLPINAYADITNVSLIHGTIFNSYKSLKANISFSISGAEGQQSFVAAFLKDTYGNYLNAPYQFREYSIQNGNFAVISESVTPTSDAKSYYNVSIYIPNNAMQIYSKDKTVVYLELAVYCVGSKSYISTNYLKGFKAKKKKYNIETYNL